MIQNVLKSLGGIQNYGILSLCLFCAIFSLVIVWAAVQKKTHLDRMARLPLEAEPEGSQQLPQPNCTSDFGFRTSDLPQKRTHHEY